MGWSVYLETDGKPVEVELFCEGGTQAVGGSTEAWVSITFNYAEVYFLFNFDLRKTLDGKKASTVLPKLKKVWNKLKGCKPFKNDYWAPTPGNAGVPIKLILGWAEQHPDAVFRVT